MSNPTGVTGHAAARLLLPKVQTNKRLLVTSLDNGSD
jgi:hypothetical protein